MLHHFKGLPCVAAISPAAGGSPRRCSCIRRSTTRRPRGATAEVESGGQTAKGDTGPCRADRGGDVACPPVWITSAGRITSYRAVRPRRLKVFPALAPVGGASRSSATTENVSKAWHAPGHRYYHRTAINHPDMGRRSAAPPQSAASVATIAARQAAKGPLVVKCYGPGVSAAEERSRADSEKIAHRLRWHKRSACQSVRCGWEPSLAGCTRRGRPAPFVGRGSARRSCSTRLTISCRAAATVR